MMAILRQLIYIFALLVLTAANAAAQNAPTTSASSSGEKQQLLWQKLEATVHEVDRNLDGVMGVAILDLTDGRTMLLHADEIFPQASSIKITVLAELYRQAQSGKLKLTDIYTVDKADLVQDSDIMGGLTPGVTRITLRDLATMMVAVSDNAATNVLIDRVGLENVGIMLNSMGLKNTRLRRKMMDVKAAKEGRENVSTPREMMALLEAIYRGKIVNPDLTKDLIAMLATHKDSAIRKAIPDTVVSADKPGELEAVRADSGIVFAQNRPFVICLMTTYLKREADGEAAIRTIAAAAYDYFDRVGRSSPYGRVVSPYNGHP